MKNTLITLILSIPPLVQVCGCLGLGMLGSKLGLAIQSRQRGPGAAELLIGLVLAAMHVGYVLAPLWWGTPRRWWVVGLMVPIAILVFAALLFVFREAWEGPDGQRRTAVTALAGAAVLYGIPIVLTTVMSRQSGA